MLGRRRKSILILAVGVLFTLAFQSCHAGAASSSPIVSILSPASGATVPVNVPVVVQASASDPDGAGVVRIDLQVNSVAVDTFEAASAQASVNAELSFTPSAEGAASVSVIAFRGDGTPSVPATIALQVVGLTQEPASEDAASEEESAEESASDEQPAAEAPPAQNMSGLTFARANVLVNIRERPGPGCNIIAQVDPNDVIEFMEVTDDPVNFWYKVPLDTRQATSNAPDGSNYVLPGASEEYGWVFQGDVGQNFTLLTDDFTPRVHELGCLFCGDGVCSAEVGEACDQCVEDCGVCPFCGDGAVNQDSEQCDGGGCGDGFTCNTGCQCELLPTAVPTVPPVLIPPIIIVPLPFCGNGICESGEDFSSCPADCLPILR